MLVFVVFCALLCCYPRACAILFLVDTSGVVFDWCSCVLRLCVLFVLLLNVVFSASVVFLWLVLVYRLVPLVQKIWGEKGSKPRSCPTLTRLLPFLPRYVGPPLWCAYLKRPFVTKLLGLPMCFPPFLCPRGLFPSKDWSFAPKRKGF